jgi:O-antigen/teichoic acid export membrane protein
MENNNTSWFFPALTLVFIILKLTQQIDWSWWMVLSPLWLPLALVLCIAAYSFGIRGTIRRLREMSAPTATKQVKKDQFINKER